MSVRQPSLLALPECANCPIRHRAVCARCEDDELKRLEEIKYYRSWQAGQTVVFVGDEMDFAATIVKGCATLTKYLEDGRTQMVGLMMPSDFIGRPGKPQAQFEVVAATDLMLCMYRRTPFEKLMQEIPHLSQRMLEMSLDELDAAREWMVLLGRKTAREKVASLLTSLFRRARLDAETEIRADLPLTREAMASYLGLTIETVSRQITGLRKDGLITLNGSRGIATPDFAALCRVAEKAA